MSTEYEKSGVDIKAGERFVDKIKPFVKETQNSNTLSDIGLFGGLFNTQSLTNETSLVASCDGVGSKGKFVRQYSKRGLASLGHDIVNHCVNDILCMGAHPLFMLDYIGVHKLDINSHSQIIQGLAEAAKIHNFPLIGGETAEMRSVYREEEFDVVGFILGAIDAGNVINGHDISSGDVVLGLPSSGFHTNGFSLINRLVEENKIQLTQEFLQYALMPHQSYFHLVYPAVKAKAVKGIAHITGGGFDNILRIIPEGHKVQFKSFSWEIPQAMSIIQRVGNISINEMFNVFNMGIGLMLVVDKNMLPWFFSSMFGFKHFYVIGEISDKKGITTKPHWEFIS